MFIIFIISAFAVSYNISVRSILASVTDDNRLLLQEETKNFISEIESKESTEEWNDVLKNYTDFDIMIENSEGVVVAKNATEIVSGEGITEKSHFYYNGEIYTVISTIHLLNGFSEHSGELIEFIITELIICLGAAIILAILIYVSLFRPYKVFYDSIEEYEKTGKAEKKSFKGYIGKVYNRFFALTQNLENHENNQKRIIASISHDIKTPLTSIMGYAERLSNDNLSPERKERYIDTIYTKALEIRQLVDEFDEYLGYNRLGKNDKKRMSLKELTERFQKEYTDELAACGVCLEVKSDVHTSCVFVDRKKINRVFGNIVGNSVKHFNETQDKKIRFTVKENKSEAVIKIADNGEGVKKEDLEMIFEPFYTSDKGRKVAGLGLSICKEIIESHSGKIYAQQADIGGLEIVIKIPVMTDF